ncbi:MAG: hypothetical protein EOP36_14490 [Rubrivivax sp.]|nr:MAG: hypothetical protein EOP36_14490 [Rubrivivax sp.]
MSGCAMKAPPYQPAIDNVQVLQRAKVRPANLGEFAVKPGAVGAEEIKLRANTMSSPVGSSFASYLGDALKQELEMANLLDAKSGFQVSGTLLGTDIDTAMGTASGYAEARFVVKQDGQVRFDKVKRGEHQWESSFVGAVAIPAAQMNYPIVLQHLLSSLYSDIDFQNSLK